jgi:hypothetical protein
MPELSEAIQSSPSSARPGGRAGTGLFPPAPDLAVQPLHDRAERILLRPAGDLRSGPRGLEALQVRPAFELLDLLFEQRVVDPGKPAGGWGWGGVGAARARAQAQQPLARARAAAGSGAPAAHLCHTCCRLRCSRARRSGATLLRMMGRCSTMASGTRRLKESQSRMLSKSACTSSWMTTGTQPCSTASTARPLQPSPGGRQQEQRGRRQRGRVRGRALGRLRGHARSLVDGAAQTPWVRPRRSWASTDGMVDQAGGSKAGWAAAQPAARPAAQPAAQPTRHDEAEDARGEQLRVAALQRVPDAGGYQRDAVLAPPVLHL